MSSENDETPTFFKTVAVIWSDIDPSTLELSELAREAEMGDAICTISRNGQADPGVDASFIGAEEFFNFEPEDTDYLSPDPSPITPAQICAALQRIEELGFGEDVDADAIVRSAATSYLAFAL
jgi:hypothetical protein